MFVKPHEVLERFGISGGHIVADLGTGSGHFALAAAKMAGEDGTVYAFDIQQDLLSRLATMAHGEHLDNISVITADLDEVGGTTLKDGSVDVAIASNVLFQIEEKGKFLKEVERILKPKGRFLLVDWSESFGNIGPVEECVVPREKAKQLVEQVGLSFVDEIPAGEHHYGLIFRKGT